MEVVLEILVDIFSAKVDNHIDESRFSKPVKILLRTLFVIFILVTLFLFVIFTVEVLGIDW